MDFCETFCAHQLQSRSSITDRTKSGFSKTDFWFGAVNGGENGSKDSLYLSLRYSNMGASISQFFLNIRWIFTI